MFYDETQAITACEEEPSLIFALMKEGHFELVDKILKKKLVSAAEIDEDGNTVLMKLLKLKQYDLVLKYMNNSDFEVNHQNKDGNTFAHIVATKDYVHVAPIIKKLKKNKEFSPNLKNNNGETVLDVSIQSGYLWTTLKFLEDYRFNNIGSRLLDYIINLVKGKCYNISLEVITDNIVAINLYKKKGFECVKIITNYYKEKNGFLMVKELD